MVNTRTDADLSVAVQNTLQALLPQMRAEIREEFCTSAGPSDAGGNPPPDAFKTRLVVYKFEGNALAWWKAYKQAKDGDAWLINTNTETSTEFMQRFLRLAGFLGATARTEEEEAKNFQWGLRRSTLNHHMCMSYTDVAQVANAARNYEIFYERDDDDTERPDKRQKSGDRHQPTSQQSSYSNHGHNNDRHGSDRRSGGDNHHSNNNYSGSNNRGQQSNRSSISGSQQSRGPSKSYSYPVCTTCGRRHPGECRRAAGTCFKCGQAGHLQKDCKKNTTASTSGQPDSKPGASGRVFAITEGHAANTSGFLATIHDTASEVPSIHDQPIVSEFPDVFPNELPGIPPVREGAMHFSKIDLRSEEHEDHLRTVLQTLRQEKLYAMFSKCEFWLSSVAFLGHIVSVEGIMMDLAKVEAITKWPRPTSVTE
nr:hypothetical protein [Tanacetum cinerariifolium]